MLEVTEQRPMYNRNRGKERHVAFRITAKGRSYLQNFLKVQYTTIQAMLGRNLQIESYQ